MLCKPITLIVVDLLKNVTNHSVSRIRNLESWKSNVVFLKTLFTSIKNCCLLVFNFLFLQVIIWNVEQGKAVFQLSCGRNAILSVSFNWDGSLLATTSKDKKLRIFDPRTQELLQVMFVCVSIVIITEFPHCMGNSTNLEKVYGNLGGGSWKFLNFE